MAMATASGLVEFARSQVGCAYLYGAFGQTVTDTLIAQKKAQYPSMYTDSYVSKALKLKGKTAYDCCGLIKCYYWQGKYQAKSDLSANGLYAAATQKGGLASLPEEPGLLLWRDGHVGVYIGQGELVEARGIDYGVVRAKVKDRNFTNWCRCPFVSYPEVAVSGEPDLKKLMDLGLVTPEDGFSAMDAPVKAGQFLAVLERVAAKLK